jgi:hypothetical protein
MTIETVQLVPHAKVPWFEIMGWRVIDDLADCHHGEYAVLMRRDATGTIPERGPE